MGAYTTLHLNEAILVTGVVVDQYSWSSGFAANLGLMLNSSSEWIELRVTDSSKPTTWEDTKGQETEDVTVFIKEVDPFRGSAFGGMRDIRLKGCLLSQALETAPPGQEGTKKRSNPTKKLPPPSNEMGIATNMFGFTSELEDVKQLPGLGVGAAILLGLFCISALVYGFHARQRHRWHISEEERVSFSPSRQSDSEEEVYDRVTTEEQ